MGLHEVDVVAPTAKPLNFSVKVDCRMTPGGDPPISHTIVDPSNSGLQQNQPAGRHEKVAHSSFLGIPTFSPDLAPHRDIFSFSKAVHRCCFYPAVFETNLQECLVIS